MGKDEKSVYDFIPKTESHSNLSNTLQPTISKAQTCTKIYGQKYTQENSLLFLLYKTEKKETKQSVTTHLKLSNKVFIKPTALLKAKNLCFGDCMSF
jgi:hypothetical protein